MRCSNVRGGNVFSRVCVPVDASTTADIAARFAISIVRGSEQPELSFCHVVNIPHLVTRADRSFDDYGAAFQLAIQAAKIVLERCSLIAEQAGVFARSSIRYGNPAIEAHAFARGMGADLIVIGSRPGHQLQRLLYGSVRDELLRTSSMPVLVATGAMETADAFRPRSILASGADAPAALPAKLMAGDLANDFAARLFFVPANRASRTIDARTIERAISDHRPDLVVLPAPPRRALAFFTPDVVDRMLQTAQVPLLIVGPGARSTR